jgi:hypothetical protein
MATVNDPSARPEDFALEELDEAWDELDKQLQREKEQQGAVDIDGGEILEGKVYDFDELEKIEDSIWTNLVW